MVVGKQLLGALPPPSELESTRVIEHWLHDTTVMTEKAEFAYTFLQCELEMY